jgi:hypothetical protein
MDVYRPPYYAFVLCTLCKEDATICHSTKESQLARSVAMKTVALLMQNVIRGYEWHDTFVDSCSVALTR